MFLRRVSKLLVAGAVVVTAGRAVGDDCASPCAAPCPPVTTCKVRVVEMVPEQVPVTRTTYKVECRNEVYTAYRCEVVPETRTCTRTVWKPVCETVMETRTSCVRVPVTEQRTCYKTVWRTVPVTETRKVMVDRGHYECQMVPAQPTLGERFGKKKKDCCEPCPKMVAKKVWVPCMVCEEKCVTTCKRVCEQVPYTACVTTCRYETRTHTVPVTRVHNVPQQVTETYTTCVTRKVPYQATRQVSVCVPVTETVTCCRMVPHCVEKEVPSVAVCCSSPAHGKQHRTKKGHHNACCGATACCN
jgi:hypothetical protein